MSNLAATYLKLGRYKDALVLQEKTLELQRHLKPVDEAALGERALGTRAGIVSVEFDVLIPGKSLGNLASTYSQLGMHRDAFLLREEALEIFRGVLPDSHPEIGGMCCCYNRHFDCQFCIFAGEAMNNLAHAHSSLGRHREALHLFQATLELRGRALSENHPQIGELRLWHQRLI